MALFVGGATTRHYTIHNLSQVREEPLLSAEHRGLPLTEDTAAYRVDLATVWDRVPSPSRATECHQCHRVCHQVRLSAQSATLPQEAQESATSFFLTTASLAETSLATLLGVAAFDYLALGMRDRCFGWLRMAIDGAMDGRGLPLPLVATIRH